MSKKKNQLDNLHADYMNEDKVETFGNREYSDDVLDLLDNENVTVTTEEIPINAIHADPTQPRAIFPHEIRGDRDGDPAKMPELLQAWAELLYDTDNDIPIVKILKGQAEPSQFKTGQGFVDKFIDLLELAYKIRNVGLLQRIGIRASAGKYIIIYGERRWTAFHILDHFLPGEDFSTIPAKVADVSEWVVAKMQAQENVRAEPNAIGKARMFAKLLMAAYADNPEANFSAPHTVNAPDCDRPWYAQVANGEAWRIPRGMGAEFETALGISTGQMRNYRNLLKLTENYEANNSIWNLADEHDWAEQFMREVGKNLDVDTINRILYRHYSDGIDAEEALREAIESSKNAAKQAAKQAQPEATSTPEATSGTKSTDQPYLNRYVELHSGFIGKVIEQRGTWIRLQHPHTDETIEASTHLIIDTDVTPPNADTPSLSIGEGRGGDDEQVNFSIGDKVRTRTGHTGQVVSTNGALILVSFGNYSTNHKPEDLTIIYQDDAETPSLSIGEGRGGDVVTETEEGIANGLAVDNANSLSFTEKHARAWVGKPAHYNGEPAFVLKTKDGMPGFVVIQIGKEQRAVRAIELKPTPAASTQTTLTDFMNKQPDRPVISSLDSLPLKSPTLLQGTDRGFIHNVVLLSAAESLKFSAMTQIYQLRADEIDDTTLDTLAQAYKEVELLANHLKDKSAMLFKDLSEHIQGLDDVE